MWRRFFYKAKPTPLGRWEHRISDKKKEIKSLQSNMDHCGDKICGQPHMFKSKPTVLHCTPDEAWRDRLRRILERINV